MCFGIGMLAFCLKKKKKIKKAKAFTGQFSLRFFFYRTLHRRFANAWHRILMRRILSTKFEVHEKWTKIYTTPTYIPHKLFTAQILTLVSDQRKINDYEAHWHIALVTLKVGSKATWNIGCVRIQVPLSLEGDQSSLWMPSIRCPNFKDAMYKNRTN